jgi:hypothetical protein
MTKGRCGLVVLVLLCLVTAARAEKEGVLRVAAGAAAGGDGSGKAPFATIGEAVARATELGGATILVGPGTYPIASTVSIRVPLVLRGSNVMEVDADGWPTGNIAPGTETKILGTAALGAATMIAVGSVSGPVLSGVTVENLTLDLGPGGGNDLDIAKTQDFLVRGNKVNGAAAFIGIFAAGSSGRIVGNYVSGVGCGTCVGGGDAASPAHIEYVGNRATGNRFGGILLNGSGTGLPETDSNLLDVDIEGNDLSGNIASPRFSFGIRIFVIRRDNGAIGDTQSDGNVVARIQGNRIVGNEMGMSIDAGFPYRQYGPVPQLCDARVYTGSFDISLRGNTLTGSHLTPALISFTRNSASFNPATRGAWQFLHGATYVIDDPEGSLTGYWLDHAETDRFTGGVCPADAAAEVLGNTLIYNGATVGYGYTVQ